MGGNGIEGQLSDVLKVLQTQNITIYAVGVGGAALPGSGKLERIHLPRALRVQRYFAEVRSATGGGTVYNDFSRDDIERPTPGHGRSAQPVHAGYTLPSRSAGIAQIEVRVRRRRGESVREGRILSVAAAAIDGTRVRPVLTAFTKVTVSNLRQ